MDSSGSTASIMDESDVDASPQRVRYVDFRIMTRTREAIPRRLAVPTGASAVGHAEQVYFPLSNNRVADVRTIQGKIAAPNLTFRNLQ